MKFLVDANVSPEVARLLATAGHDAVAVRDVQLQDAPDDEILDRALSDDRVIISHDTDFGTLLPRHQTKPSFILVRSADPLTTTQIADLIIDNLDTMAGDLQAGAIITFARGRLRSRRLPLQQPAVAVASAEPAGTRYPDESMAPCRALWRDADLIRQ